MASPGKAANGFRDGVRHVSKRLVLSYIVDWIVIVATAAVGGVFHVIHGNRHPFDLRDRSISYPMHNDTVSGTLLVIVSFVAPGIIVFFVALLFVPGPTVPKGTPKSLIWRRKFWEINTGWMGLGLSLAGAFMVTEGLKDLYGKPRPDLLARCDPDVANVSKFIVGGLSQQLADAPIMVSYKICRQTDNAILSDGFASFPSGHSSFSFAGLLYLTLYLASKFSIYIPYLPLTSATDSYAASPFRDYHRLSIDESRLPAHRGDLVPPAVPLRNRSAAPPLPALVIVFLPLGTALFITASRWFNDRHHGFDIIVGSLMGIFFAWFSFRWYHLPVRRGSGWSWGARTRDRGFWTGVGTGGWVGQEGWTDGHNTDLEGGTPTMRNGTADILGPGQRDKMEVPQEHQQSLFGPASGHHSTPSAYEMRNMPGDRGAPRGVARDKYSSGTPSEWNAV